MKKRKMRLLGSLITGPTVQHHGMWRHPDTQNRFLEAGYYEEVARLLEHGRFDGCFFPDAQGLPETHDGSHVSMLEHGGGLTLLDPLPLLAIMSRVTTRLGLGATVSATHVPPYHLARTLATLDLLTNGRIAWNVVTSTSAIEAQNFGADSVQQRIGRYDRADEVLEACFALWGSWDADALIMDKAGGRFADGSKIRSANYLGKWLRSRGPLTVPRSPQGHPVIMQAGASDRGRDFAARWAEMIFTVQGNTRSMIAFYDDIKSRMEKFGRRPDQCVILPSIDVIVGETQSIAREKQAYANELATEAQGLATMSFHLGMDLSQLPLDEPLVDVQLAEGSRGMLDVVMQSSQDEKLTLRQAAKRYAVAPFSPQVVGSPTQVADELQHYFEAGGCDGYIVKPTTAPGTFEQMVRLVIPELQRRGIFRNEYQHTHFRNTVLTGE